MKAYQNERPVQTITKTSRSLQFCLLLAAGLLLSACGGKVSVTNGNDITGVYALVTINGSQIPATVNHEGAALQVRSGTFTINADGTCRSKMIFVPPSGTEAKLEVKATYVREGSKLNMRWQGAGSTTGSVQDRTFTMNNEGMIFAYRK